MNTYQQIVAYLAKVLPQLDNLSQSSILGRIIFTFSTIIDAFKLELSRSEDYIITSARSQKILNKQYYIEKALAFQLGSQLAQDPATGELYYDTLYPDAQIIKQLAVSFNVGTALIYLKVAKQENGINIPLDAHEIVDFQDYMQNFMPLGIQFQIMTGNADILMADMVYIYYSRTYSLTDIKIKLQASLTTLQTALRGDDPLFQNDIESMMKAIPGIRDAYFENILINGSISPDNGRIDLPAGYFNFAEELMDVNSSYYQYIVI